MKALVALTLALSLFSAACSSTKIDEGNPEDLYKGAEEDIKDKRYLQAAERLRMVKNKFPYSHLSTQAALRLADVAFLEEAYPEAAVAYETFRDLHPKHEKADYVLFRIGESYYRQMPDTVDRDQSPGIKAIEALGELEKVYPNSQYMPEAKQRAFSARDKLAAKEEYVAEFYWKEDQFESAALRFQKIVKTYAGSKSEQRAYIRWAEALARQKKVDEARHVLDSYLSRFPSGEYADRAKRGI